MEGNMKVRMQTQQRHLESEIIQKKMLGRFKINVMLYTMLKTND